MERWLKWQPIPGIPRTMYLERLLEGENGLELLLKGEEHDTKSLCISFAAPLSYRNTDEGDLLLTLATGEGEEPGSFTLFTVENSRYAMWLEQESQGVRPASSVVHFRIATPNDVVDVLDKEEPTVRWISSMP